MELLRDVPPGSAVTLGAAPERVSALIGQHRANVEAIRRGKALRALSVKPCAQAGKAIVLLAVVPDAERSSGRR